MIKAIYHDCFCHKYTESTVAQHQPHAIDHISYINYLFIFENNFVQINSMGACWLADDVPSFLFNT